MQQLTPPPKVQPTVAVPDPLPCDAHLALVATRHHSFGFQPRSAIDRSIGWTLLGGINWLPIRTQLLVLHLVCELWRQLRQQPLASIEPQLATLHTLAVYGAHDRPIEAPAFHPIVTSVFADFEDFFRPMLRLRPARGRIPRSETTEVNS
jgi:hypothetical protein